MAFEWLQRYPNIPTFYFLLAPFLELGNPLGSMQHLDSDSVVYSTITHPNIRFNHHIGDHLYKGVGNGFNSYLLVTF
jgi:hypothetical protein